jgi:hypothetical protein
MELFQNPFRPGAGQKPPYLAGRQDEQVEFREMLKQVPVLQNIILTGLRGVGKTVLLDTFKPIAINEGWLWTGTDFSESATVSERSLCTRIITDLASITGAFRIHDLEKKEIGFPSKHEKTIPVNFIYLMTLFENTAGLETDKLKKVLETVWDIVKTKAKGIILAYDEAQILKDQATDKQYPLSLVLEVVQYLQRKQIPYLLILTGLQTLFPNLVAARTYAERMFHTVTLDRLRPDECRAAIMNPIEIDSCPVRFTENAILEIIKYSGGYPYFIQFLCKQTFDLYIQQMKLGIKKPIIILEEILRKLDADFYSGRWARITDRQRDLLKTIALLSTCEEEFTVQDIAEKSKQVSENPFSGSYISQLLNKLVDAGLIYKNRYGKYSFAVPMLSGFIKRQENQKLNTV